MIKEQEKEKKERKNDDVISSRINDEPLLIRGRSREPSEKIVKKSFERVMYTRSRSTGGPGFSNSAGRGQMNQANAASSFPTPHPYDSQGSNFTRSIYKPGLIEPSAPFKPSGAPSQQQQQQQHLSQAMKPRAPQLQPQQQQQQQQATPTTPRLKPILKQSSLAQPSPVPPPPVIAAAAATTPPVNRAAPLVAKLTTDAAEKTVEEAGNASAQETTEEDAAGRWAEDDQGKWVDGDEQGSWMDTEDGQQERPKWRRFKKIPGNKPNKKLKRLRMNQRLRKALMPKNAIMVLNEMKAGVQFTFPETQAIMPNSLFLVHAELEGKIYVGQGLSKPLARQNAAENALKSLLLEKMTAAAMKERVEADGDVVMETGTTAAVAPAAPATTDEASRNAQSAVKEENGGGGDEAIEENDDVPWSSLASFALYKLFLEWQNQGTVVPIPRPGVPAPSKNRPEPKPAVEKQLPPNAIDVHPVMLLNQMRPGTTYTEVGRVGTPPNIQFTLGVEVNGTTYSGTAKNKKDAKKQAAKAALKALYNLDYPEEMKVDGGEQQQQPAQ